MSFVLYVVVLVVSVTSVMMGLDWLSTPPPPPLPKSVQTASAPAKPPAPPKAKETASTQTTVATGKANPAKVVKVDAAKQPEVAAKQPEVAVKQPAVAVAAPETAGSAPVTASDGTSVKATDGTPNIATNESDAGGATAQANAAPPPRCDVQACAAHYRTFNPSDCTFQPFDGPRRLCTIGNPPTQANAAPASVQTSDASQPPAPSAASSCNYQACSAAYYSFRASDCTYQPYDGPRRLCTKSGDPRSARDESPDDLRGATRAVRRLPPRDRVDDAYDSGDIVVIHRRGPPPPDPFFFLDPFDDHD
jgi:BA14K-like protein